MKEERIDNYVVGKMTADERLSFEQEMTADVALQKEVALHREIVQAIRMKAAKVHLQKVERQIRTEERRRKVFTIRIVTAAIAACLAVGIFVDIDNRGNYKDYAAGITIAQAAQAAPTRGERDVVNDVVIKIKDKNYTEALATIEEAMVQDISVSERDELEWYKAVTYMRMGKWVKACKLLKQIAASDSAYSEDAQKALDEL